MTAERVLWDRPRRLFMFSVLLSRLDTFFQRRARNSILFIALVIAMMIGVADYFIQPDILIFYLVPIFFAAWYGGRKTGHVISIYSAGACYISDAINNGNQVVEASALWSFAARLAIFLVLSRILSTLHESREQQKDLTGFIVHDLRSPISSSITGLMTLEQTAEGLDELSREMVSLALVSNQRALALVNSLLDVSKLESGKMEIRREPVQLGQLVNDALEQVSLWAKGQNVELKSEVPDDTVVLDPILTMRVLVNLLSNALKFSPPETSVVVRAEHNSKEGLRFTVQDHGPGIPSDYTDKIFEPFGQVRGTKGGTGLGLTFCRLAVQAQGGRIWVESQLGKGTSMHFSLPHTMPRPQDTYEHTPSEAKVGDKERSEVRG